MDEEKVHSKVAQIDELDEAENLKLFENLKRIGGHLVPVLNAQKKIEETISFYVEALNISALQNSISRIVDAIKDIDPEKYHEESLRDLEERAERLSEFGWAFIFDVNGDCFFEDSLLQMEKDDVDQYMLNFYEENEHKNLKYLGKYIGERNPIWKEQLEDSIRLFINGDHKVVTPFAMTLIEAEIVRYSGREKHSSELRKDFKERIRKVDDDYIFIATLLIDKFIQKIFKGGTSPDVKGELLNRNVVLHGKSNPELWGKVEFLKILNVVGSLAMLDDMFEIEKVS